MSNYLKRYYATFPRKVKGLKLWSFNIRDKDGCVGVYTLTNKKAAMSIRSAYTTWEDLKPVSNVSQPNQLTLTL
jgi:hypothetical protein